MKAVNFNKKGLRFNKKGLRSIIYALVLYLWLIWTVGLISCSGKKNNSYLITDFGAVALSSVVNTQSIQAAINKCAEEGGGTVVVPEGTFLTGAIFLKQGVNLEIDAGGVLKGTTNMSDYKLVRTRWEGEERIWVSALINVFDVSGFAGGKIAQQAPELSMKVLIPTDSVINMGNGDTISLILPEEVVSATAFNRESATSQILDINNGTLNWRAPEGEWTVRMVQHALRSSPTRSVNNPTKGKDPSHALIDYLDSAATDKFIEFTHEEYKKYVGEEFGKTILGFRGDEPDYSVRGLPWTPELFDLFQKQKGYDVRPFVSSFFTEKLTDEQRRIKADYWDVWSSLFADNFLKYRLIGARDIIWIIWCI